MSKLILLSFKATLPTLLTSVRQHWGKIHIIQNQKEKKRKNGNFSLSCSAQTIVLPEVLIILHVHEYGHRFYSRTPKASDWNPLTAIMPSRDCCALLDYTSNVAVVNIEFDKVSVMISYNVPWWDMHAVTCHGQFCSNFEETKVATDGQHPARDSVHEMHYYCKSQTICMMCFHSCTHIVCFCSSACWLHAQRQLINLVYGIRLDNSILSVKIWETIIRKAECWATNSLEHECFDQHILRFTKC